MQHAKLGASSSSRWLNCPGSLNFIASQPKFLLDDSSEFADEGTLAHETAEKMLLTGESFEESVDTKELLPPDMKEAVETYVDHARQMITDDTGVYVEHRFKLNDQMFGTNDLCIEYHSTKTLHVLDYKHGVGVVVEPEENSQLMYYALGALKEFGEDWERVVLTIVQPRAFHDDGPIRSWSTTVQRLKEFETELLEGAEATRDPYAPLIAGDHCRFCPALAVCPAYKSMIVGAMNAPNIADNMKVAANLSQWKKAIERVAFKAMSQGVKVPGFKLVEKRTQRKWLNEDKVAKELEDDGHPKESIYKRTRPQLAGIGAIEKLAGKSWVAERCFKPVGEATIAPESDRRPSITRADADFADIELQLPDASRD